MRSICVEDRDRNFDDAFDYFFHSNCNHVNGIDSLQITRRIHNSAGFIKEKAKCINTMANVNKKINLMEIYEKFVASLGEHESTSTVRLNALLESSAIKNLFFAYDSIVSYSNNKEFPQALSDDEKCLCYLSGRRLVNIVISGGDEDVGVILDVDGRTGYAFVADMSKRGAVYNSGCIKVGDFILEINGSDTKFKNIDELEELLRYENCPEGILTFLVESYDSSHATPPQIDFPFYVRALLDYSVNTVEEIDELKRNKNILDFSRGNVLKISGYFNRRWIKAELVSANSLILDNKIRDELDDLDEEQEDEEATKIIPNFYMSQENNVENMMKKSDAFERVIAVRPSPNVIRCVLFIGPRNVGRNELKSRLLNAFPEKYGNVVPHTTRRPRKYETEGVNYNFVALNEMRQLIYDGECIEFGEYNKNLYGTTFGSVLKVMAEGRIPVLNVHPSAILKLRNVTFKPLIIFVRPPDILTLKQTRQKSTSVENQSSSGDGSYFSDMDLKDMISAAAELQRTYGAYFDAVLTNGVLEEAVAELCRILSDFDTLPSFIPQEWVDWI